MDDERAAEGQSARGLREVLTTHHAYLERLFQDVITAFQANRRDAVAELWSEFDGRLTRHLDLEDQWLLPGFAKIDPAGAAQLADEHQRIRATLMEFGVGVDLHLTRSEMVDAFIARLRAHARREDELMYRWAEEHLEEAGHAAIREGLSDTPRPGHA